MTKISGIKTNLEMLLCLFRVAATLILITLISCSPPPKNPTSTSSDISNADTRKEATLTVTDSTNTTLTLEKLPERIVCLDFVCVDVLAELGIEPVGILQSIADWVQQPHLFGERGKNFAQIAGVDNVDPNLEQIVQLKPDIVIGLNGFHNQPRDALKGVVPFYLLSTPQTYSEAIANLKNIGKLTGKTVEAEVAAQRFLDKLGAYKSKSPQNQTVLLIHSPAQQLNVITDKALNCATLNEVANCLSPEYDNELLSQIGTFPFSLERLVKLNPDVILISSYAMDDYAEFVNYSDNPLWEGLTAVQNRRVYGANPLRLLSFGTRGLSMLLDRTLPKIYPDVFPESQPSLTQKSKVKSNPNS